MELTPKKLRLAALAILMAGCALATWLYLTAPEENATLADDYLQSKKYAHELNRYGGKMTVVADDLSRWFSGLWQGRRQALTVALLTGLAAVSLFILAGRRPPAGPSS